MICARFPIILASGSAVRQKLLSQAGIPFTVQTSDVDEDALRTEIADLPTPQQAEVLAKAKGIAVSKEHPHSLVISADQICEHDGHILTKPGTRDNAIATLQQLQNSTHKQHSAVAVSLYGECVWSTVESATLSIRKLSDDDIEAYIDMDTPLQACGAYHYEEHGKHLFANVEGRDDVVMGLPLQTLINQLHCEGYLSFKAKDDSSDQQFALL